MRSKNLILAVDPSRLSKEQQLVRDEFESLGRQSWHEIFLKHTHYPLECSSIVAEKALELWSCLNGQIYLLPNDSELIRVPPPQEHDDCLMLIHEIIALCRHQRITETIYVLSLAVGDPLCDHLVASLGGAVVSFTESQTDALQQVGQLTISDNHFRTVRDGSHSVEGTNIFADGMDGFVRKTASGKTSPGLIKTLKQIQLVLDCAVEDLAIPQLFKLSQELKYDGFGVKLRYTSMLRSVDESEPQVPHLDFKEQVLNEYRLRGLFPYLVFTSASQAGSFLQVWRDHTGTLLRIPLGKALILPADTMHGGGFMSDPKGNLRLHSYLIVGAPGRAILSSSSSVSDFTNDYSLASQYQHDPNIQTFQTLLRESFGGVASGGLSTIT